MSGWARREAFKAARELPKSMTPIGYAAIIAFVGCAAAFVWLMLRIRQVE